MSSGSADRRRRFFEFRVGLRDLEGKLMWGL